MSCRRLSKTSSSPDDNILHLAHIIFEFNRVQVIVFLAAGKQTLTFITLIINAARSASRPGQPF